MGSYGGIVRRFVPRVCIGVMFLLLSSFAVSCDTVWDYILMYRPGRARSIRLETYVMDRDQVAEIYNYPHPARPYQKPNCELVGKPQYLVVHFNNRGLNGSCILRWQINEGRYTETRIRQMQGAYLGCVEYYVVPVGSVVDQDDMAYPEVTYKIKRLFVDYK